MSITSKQERPDGRRGQGASWAGAWQRLTRPRHSELVRDLRVALQDGGARVAELLRPDVSVVVDSGAEENPTIRVVRGADDAVALLVHGMGRQSGVLVEERSVNGQAGLVLSRDGEPVAAVAVDVVGGRVSLVWIRLHPVLLRHGTTV
jgi:hypothetical protein